jgi:hypothetical protein
VQDGRIHIEKINWPFLSELKGSPAEYSAGLKLAIERGWLSVSPHSDARNVTAAQQRKNYRAACPRTATSDALYDLIGIGGLFHAVNAAGVRGRYLVVYPPDFCAVRSLQFASHRSTAFIFNGGMRIDNLNSHVYGLCDRRPGPCDRRPVEDTERRDEDRSSTRKHRFHFLSPSLLTNNSNNLN